MNHVQCDNCYKYINKYLEAYTARGVCKFCCLKCLLKFIDCKEEGVKLPR